MLTGYRKKLVKETISYFIDTTGLPVDTFILYIQRNNMKDESVLNYKEWLAVKSFQLLKSNGITLADCLEFRNLAAQLKLEKKGMNVTLPWKHEIAKCINSTDISGYTLLEVSDLNSELNYIPDKEVYYFNTEEVVFNFFNTFDFDKNNCTFLKLLPKEVRKAILYKTPLFINFNPYLEHSKKIDNIVGEMKLFGHSHKDLLNVQFASLFRILKLCQEYQLTDVRIGFFSSLDMFYEKPEYLEFYNDFRRRFKFNTGICFNPKSVGVKDKDKADFIGYSIWDLKKEKDKDVSVVLEEKIQYTEDTILSGTPRLLRGKKDSLFDWVSTGILNIGDKDEIPVFLNIQTKSEQKIDRYENVLGYLQNTKNLLRSLNKVGVYSVPLGENTPITSENFYKSVASFVVRSSLSQNVNLKESPVYLSNPDMEIAGYDKWLTDAVVYFLFSPLNMTKSYREKDFNLANRFFPLSYSEVRHYVSDENIINDMNTHNVENLRFLHILESLLPSVSKEGMELYNFCINKIKESLKGKNRENVGYKDSLVAWDAGFYQIRGMSKLFTPTEEDKYNYLLSKLKDKLDDGIYKYGFISVN